ncbi:PSP1 domain-containing protein [Desulfobacterota bacterium M19]
MGNSAEKVQPQQRERQADSPKSSRKKRIYLLRFRAGQHLWSALSTLDDLKLEDVVMVQSDHGLEPAIIAKGGMYLSPENKRESPADNKIVRRARREEIDKFNNLTVSEAEAFAICRERIEKLSLKMKLIRVERFFNGSNIIFYFTADNRVDFRELVKGLVQEFRTRVEMRQIGVRHETKMIGGIGCCGRELCCSSFMSKFVPVSIKMVKEQELPLNPIKISGVCNRLLCCLTHEFSTYKALKKGRPKNGKIVDYLGRQCRVKPSNILQEMVKLSPLDAVDEIISLPREEWHKIKPFKPAVRGGAEARTGADKAGAKTKSRPRPEKDKAKAAGSSPKSSRSSKTGAKAGSNRPRKGKKARFAKAKKK